MKFTSVIVATASLLSVAHAMAIPVLDMVRLLTALGYEKGPASNPPP